MANEMRDRLLHLIHEAEEKFTDRPVLDIEKFVADHLIENGVEVPSYKVGDTIWVIEIEDDEAVDVTGYMFLAQSKGYIIATPFIHDRDTDETLEYHAIETMENYDTKLVVYPEVYCFPAKEEAEQKLKEMRGE